MEKRQITGPTDSAFLKGGQGSGNFGHGGRPGERGGSMAGGYSPGEDSGTDAHRIKSPGYVNIKSPDEARSIERDMKARLKELKDRASKIPMSQARANLSMEIYNQQAERRIIDHWLRNNGFRG